MPKRGRQIAAKAINLKSRKSRAGSKSTESTALLSVLSKLDTISNRLSRIESLAKVEYAEEEKVEAEEEKVEAEEHKVEADEEAQLVELKKLESIEQEIEEQVKVKPFRKISYRDFSKSAIGAFFGILGHFSFFYGVELSKDISVARADVLYFVAFIIGAVFLYTTGYKSGSKNVWFMLLRLFIIYFTSIVTIVIVLFLFNFANMDSSFIELYKTVATISILAVMGAIAADLIGRESE